ncbi:MAG: hypothetical protein KDJ68_13285 [Rhodobiaceae bacterium]|nr:hypothetical protein [Rhodobiaceae bacterium]
MSYQDHMLADARLIILRALADEIDYSLNETILLAALENYGHRQTREFVRTEINWLRQMSAVTVREAGTIVIATITPRGLDHVERRTVIEGVKRPSPPGE